MCDRLLLVQNEKNLQGYFTHCTTIFSSRGAIRANVRIQAKDIYSLPSDAGLDYQLILPPVHHSFQSQDSRNHLSGDLGISHTAHLLCHINPDDGFI